MRWGFDAAFAPSDATLQTMQRLGYSFGCGYIGGKAFHAWPRSDFERLAAVNFDVLPIWVAPLEQDPGRDLGVDHGNQALRAMQAYGLTGVLCLDVEDGLVPQEYATGFLDATRAGSCRVVLYGSTITLLALADLNWLAWWLARPGGDLPFTPQSVDWSMVQWGAAPGVDLNWAGDDFPFAGRS